MKQDFRIVWQPTEKELAGANRWMMAGIVLLVVGFLMAMVPGGLAGNAGVKLAGVVVMFIGYLSLRPWMRMWSDRKSYQLCSSREFRMNWRVTPDGKLLFGGRDMTPIHPMFKVDLEQHVARMKEKIRTSGHPIVIREIWIEDHIATGLWNEGAITLEHLKSSWRGTNGGVSFKLQLAGEEYTISIQSATYYGDYEFIVDGNPNGDVRVRDIPDALAVIAGESVELAA